MKMSLKLLAVGACVGVWATGAARAQEPDFYEAQLRAGRDAFLASRLPESIDRFQIAAFGFLNRPALLSETLARLALAQERAHRTAEVTATLEQLLAVERRFKSFETASLENETRSALHRLIASSLPRQALLELPSLSGSAASRIGAGDSSVRQPLPPPAGAGTPSGERGVPAAERDARRLTPAANSSEPPGSDATRVPVQSVPFGAEEPASPSDADAVFEPPRYRATVKPSYPLAALRRRIGGIVLLRVLVSETGAPVTVEVLRQVHPELSAAAVGAVRRWEFEPARRNGVAIAAWTTVPIPFRP